MVLGSAVSRPLQTSHPKHPKFLKEQGSAIHHAVRLIHAICGLAGSATLIDDIRVDLQADKVQPAIRHRDTVVGTVCGKAARTDLCGGCEVTRIPYAGD
jgi:hypothetical protein